METRPLETTRAGATEIEPGIWTVSGDWRDVGEAQVRTALRAAVGANVDFLDAVGVRAGGRGE